MIKLQTPSIVVSALASVLVLAVPSVHARRFNGEGVAETLRQAQEECCPARNHGAYVSCAAHVCNRAIKAQVLHASQKVIILKHGCDNPSTTTTTKQSTTTTTKPSTTSTTKPSPTTTVTRPPTTTTTEPPPSTTTTSEPPTTTSTTEAPTTTSSTTTSTTATTETTTSSTSTTSTTESTSTTSSTTTSTIEPTTTTTTSSTTTTEATATTTTARPSSTTITTTSSTTMPGGEPTPTTTLPREICGNCIDDDHNGQTDFEDAACCSDAQTFTMVVSRGRLRPRGPVSRLRLKAVLARAGLDRVNPLAQDVFLQIRPAGGADILCAKVPANKFMRMHGAFKFWDRKHVVTSARGINDMTVRIRRDGSVRLKTLGRRAQMQTPAQGVLQVTIGFHDPAGDAANRCSSVAEPFRTGRRGALRAP